MSSASISPSGWQAGFLSVVPAIETHARIQFRRLPPCHREEAVQEAIAAACCGYQLLASQGRLDVAYPSTLAAFAVRHVRQGRHVGAHQDAAQDVLSPRAQQRHAFQVHSWETWRMEDPSSPIGRLLQMDRKAKMPVPDLVACRLDFARWLRSWPKRQRKIIKALASGERTGDVAARFSLSPARISQLRGRFRHDWQVYQGQGAQAA